MQCTAQKQCKFIKALPYVLDDVHDGCTRQPLSGVDQRIEPETRPVFISGVSAHLQKTARIQIALIGG